MATTPPSAPSTARRLVFPAANSVEIESFPVGATGPDEVLIETQTSLMSTGTETIAFARKFEAGTHWDKWVRYPFYPGYASVGIVRDVGPGATRFAVGQRVACRGGHRSHHLLPAAQCYAIPDSIASADAVWFALAKIAGHGVRAAGITLGENVLVIGAGPIGQMAVRWARAAGAGKVLCLDLAETRLQLAADAGAIPIAGAPASDLLERVTRELGGERPPIVIDSTGNAAVLRTAFSLTANHGVVVLLGDTGTPGGQTLTGDVISRGLRLVGAHDVHNTPAWNNPVSADRFFSFVADGRFPTRGLNTHHFKPEACQEAYALAVGDRLRTMGILFDWTDDASTP